MFKKVVSLCLSTAVAMSMNVIAGAEAEHWEAPLENMGNLLGQKNAGICVRQLKNMMICAKRT